MQDNQTEELPRKRYLDRNRDNIRKYFYADWETLRDLEEIERFYSIYLEGKTHSLSLVLRRAVKTLANQIRDINEKNDDRDLLAFLRLGAGGQTDE